MNQTLKGKTIEVRIGNKTCFGHLDKDILSAIDWLKGEINFEGSIVEPGIKEMIIEIIDRAFEGVQKE